MSARCKVKSYSEVDEVVAQNMNLDVLARALRDVDLADYDHPHLGKVFGYISRLCKREQLQVIKAAVGQEFTFDQLLSHVINQFVILEQSDNKGQFCGLGFGEECVSVATWDGLEAPMNAEEVSVTKLCYKGADGKLRCGHLLSFLEFTLDYKEMTFQELCDCIKRQK